MTTPTPVEQHPLIADALDTIDRCNDALVRFAAVRKALDPHRKSVPPDSECQRSETDVEVIERLVAERDVLQNIRSAQVESATTASLYWMQEAEKAKKEADSAILLGLRAAALLTADHDCGEEHDAALEALQTKIAALTADGARSVVEVADLEEARREWTKIAPAQRGVVTHMSATEAMHKGGLPAGQYLATKEEFEAACRADTYTETHTVGGLSGRSRTEPADGGDAQKIIYLEAGGVPIWIPRDDTYNKAAVGDVLNWIRSGWPRTDLTYAVVKTNDGAEAVVRESPKLTFEISKNPRKIEVGQVWEDCDGRQAMVTRLPPLAPDEYRFRFRPVDGVFAVGPETNTDYGVIFDGARNIVKANGCKLISGPGAPWPAK